MYVGESFVSGSSGNHNVLPYDYGDKKADSGKVLKFNGDLEELSWWKTNFYSYIMGLDEELWDILEDGVGDLDLDEEVVVVGRKKHTPAQKKMYKKHDENLIFSLSLDNNNSHCGIKEPNYFWFKVLFS